MLSRPCLDRAVMLAAALALAAATLAAYHGVLANGFVNYDDDLYITKVPAVQAGLTLESVGWAFTTFHGANWFPLTWLSWMLDAELYGLSPRGFHATSLALHVANVAARAARLHAAHRLARRGRLHGGRLRAAPAARRVGGVGRRAQGRALGLLLDARAARLRALGAARSLAAARRGRRVCLRARAAREAGPGDAPVRAAAARRLAAAASPGRGRPRLGPGPGPARAAREGRPVRDRLGSSGCWCSSPRAPAARCARSSAIPLGVRVANAVVAYATYLRRAFLPTDLAVFYPHPGDSLAARRGRGGGGDPARCQRARVLAAPAPPAARWSAGCGGWSTLAPAIGIVQVGQAALADRYTYLAQSGLVLALAATAAPLAARSRATRIAAGALALAVLLALGAATSAQVRTWRSSETLFEHALRVTQRNHVAHVNLGSGASRAPRARLSPSRTCWRRCGSRRPPPSRTGCSAA